VARECGRSDHGRLDDVGILTQRVLDLLRIDLESATVDEPRLARRDRQRAGTIAAPEIAGEITTVAKAVGGRRGVANVLRGGERARDNELALLVWAEQTTGVADHLHG